MIIALVIGILTIVSAVAIYTLIDSDKASNVQVEGYSLEGHWYMVYCERFDLNGEVDTLSVISNPEIADYDIDIDYCKNGIIYGSNKNQELYGAYSNNVIGMTGNDRFTNCYGTVNSDDYMILNCTGLVDDIMYANVCIYTQDPSRPMVEELEQITDIKGTWHKQNGVEPGSEPVSFTIDDQIGAMLSGNIVYNDATWHKFYGSVQTNEHGSFIGCIIIDNNDTVMATIDEDTISLSGLFDGVNGTSYYSKSGSIEEKEPIMQLEKTTWIVNHAVQLSTDLEISHTLNIYTLTLDKQIGNRISGIWSVGTDRYQATLCLTKTYGYAGDIATGLILSVNSADNILYGTGVITKSGIMHISFRDDNILNPNYITNAKTLINTADLPPDENIEGHWYASNVTIIDKIGEVINIDTDSLNEYDVDFIKNNDGLIWTYFQSLCTITYLNGIINFDGYDSGTVLKGYGWKGEAEVITMVISISTPCDNHHYDTQVIYMNLTRDYSTTVITEKIDYSILGTWSCFDGFSMTANGELHPILGKDITITEQNNGLFIGTMEDADGNDVETKNIKGFITAGTNGHIKGWLIDDRNDMWTLDTINDDALSLKKTGKSHLIGLDDQNVVTDRHYTRNANTFDEKEVASLEGSTYRCNDYVTMDNKGNCRDIYSITSITIAKQYGNSVCGTFSTVVNGNLNTGTVIGFMTLWNEKIVLNLYFAKDGNPGYSSNGYLMMGADNVVLSINQIVEGNVISGLAYMEMKK